MHFRNKRVHSESWAVSCSRKSTSRSHTQVHALRTGRSRRRASASSPCWWAECDGSLRGTGGKQWQSGACGVTSDTWIKPFLDTHAEHCNVKARDGNIRANIRAVKNMYGAFIIENQTQTYRWRWWSCGCCDCPECATSSAGGSEEAPPLESLSNDSSEFVYVTKCKNTGLNKCNICTHTGRTFKVEFQLNLFSKILMKF